MSAEYAPATPVEQALARAADAPDDVAASDEFLAQFLESTVGVPGVADTEGFTPLIRRYLDRSHAVAFTHRVRWERFAATADDLDVSTTQARPTTARELLSQLVQANIPLLLNPANGYGKEFTVPEMSDLLAGIRPGSQERLVQQEQQIAVGVPAHVPEGLIERLTDHLRRLGGVSSATLAWVRYADGLQGYLLGIRGTVAREEVLGADFTQVVGDLDGRTLDVMFGGPDTALPTDSVPPFLQA